jgi:hypothetical protein
VPAARGSRMIRPTARAAPAGRKSKRRPAPLPAWWLEGGREQILIHAARMESTYARLMLEAEEVWRRVIREASSQASQPTAARPPPRPAARRGASRAPDQPYEAIRESAPPRRRQFAEPWGSGTPYEFWAPAESQGSFRGLSVECEESPDPDTALRPDPPPPQFVRGRTEPGTTPDFESYTDTYLSASAGAWLVSPRWQSPPPPIADSSDPHEDIPF